MKQLFSLYLFMACCLHLSAQKGMNIQLNGQSPCVVHHVMAGETVYQLARDYHVKPSTILRFNEMGSDTRLRSGASIQIPLTETNYFRMSGLSEASGYTPLRYTLREGDLTESLMKRFMLSPQAFQSWNGTTAYTAGQTVTVGWLKYNRGTKETASYIEEDQQRLSAQAVATTGFQEEEQTIEANVSGSKALSNSVLNPRYMPHATTGGSKPVRSTPFYARPEVKKQTSVIQDETHDVWFQIKRFFSGGNNGQPKVVSTSTSAKVSKPSDYVSERVDVSDKKPTPLDDAPVMISSASEKKQTTATSSSKASTPKASYRDNREARPSSLREPSTVKESWWTRLKGNVSGTSSRKDRETPMAMPTLVRNDPNRSAGAGTQAFRDKLKHTFSFERKKSYTSYVPPAERSFSASATPKSAALSAKGINKSEDVLRSTSERKAKEIPVEKKRSFWDKLVNGKELPSPKPRQKPVAKSNASAIKPQPATSNKTAKEAAPRVLDNTPVIDPVLRNEIRPLSLKNSRSGRCAYFFGGPSGGKFYVATNLAPRGQMVKITNPENGKFVMAEVLSALPASDVSKGLLLKVSDNAKLPLGQKGTVFTLRINY